MEQSDQALLEEFLNSGSNRPFEALVRRHAGVVFGAALRVTTNREWAEDAAQLVFAILHRKAGDLTAHPNLPAWLHKTSTLEAARIMRKERNHQRKLRRLSSATPDSGLRGPGSPAADHPALHHLDEAMASLGPADRQFLMMRFYQGYKLRELASLLGKSEAAVRKQSERAISRLEKILRKRGASISTTALVGLLSTAFVEPASASLVNAITHGAAAASASLPSSALILNALQTMTYGKQIALTATAVALLAAVPVGIQTRRLEKTRIELREARGAAAPASSLRRESVTEAPPIPDRSPAESEPDGLWKEAALSGGTDADFLRDLLTRQSRPPQEEIAAFIGSNRSLSELRSMFDEVVDLPLGEHQRAAVQKLVMEIGRHDGEYAIELAATLTGATVLRHHALGAAYAGWASHDPEAAWAFANALPPEQRAAHPYWQIMTGAAQGDLSSERFYGFVEAHSPDLLALSGGHLWQALSHVYDHKNSEGMPTWVDGLPASPLKNLATANLIQRWALSDPTAARDWMEAHVNPHEDPQPTLQLARGWAQVDPPAAMNWLTSLPPELQTKEQFSGALGKWLSYDQMGAANWLAQAEPSPLLDDPFEQYIDRMRHIDPAEAMNWTEAITDSDHRQRVMKKVANVWRKNDPEGLDHFLATEPAAAGLR